MRYVVILIANLLRAAVGMINYIIDARREEKGLSPRNQQDIGSLSDNMFADEMEYMRRHIEEEKQFNEEEYRRVLKRYENRNTNPDMDNISADGVIAPAKKDDDESDKMDSI